MIDSTARAQRFESESSPAPAYLWAPPQKALAVSIPLAVIDQLEREAVESFRSLSSRGSEIGGVLFGSVVPGSPLTVAIEGYQPVECDYTSGPLYRLSNAELDRLDRAIEQRLASGLGAVGFYRSHTRKGLSLDADDLALFESRFREPHHIALLIRPAATKASMAGIFFREDGKVHAEASCLEFPFRSPQHDGARHTDTLYDGAVAGPRSVTAAAAPPKPVIRAQIVPIASRREIAPEPPLPVAIESAPEAPAQPAPAPPPVVAAAVEPVVSKPVSPAEKQLGKGSAGESAVSTTPQTPPAPKGDPIAAAPKKRSSKLMWIMLGVAVPAVLSIGFIFSSGILHRGSRAIPGAAQDTSALALRVDRNGADIVLTWNRDANVIKQASKAMLSISDGPQQENVAMDLAQLRNGSIVYSPVTSDVVFRMEVSGADQTKTVSESVRVLRTRPSPMPETPSQPAADQPPQQARAAKAETPAAQPAEAAAAPAAEEEKPVALAQAVRPFHAESLAQRLRPSTSAELPDAPMLGGPGPAPSANVNLGNIVSTQQAPLPAPSSSGQSAEKKVNSGGQIQQAQLLRRRDPEYPKLARDAGASGVVELLATVGTDGKVKSVQVVRGHPLLRQAAVDAVKSWVYRPTLLNGVPVETQTQVLLNFKGDR